MPVAMLPEAATRVFIALGSNLGNPSAQVERGMQMLSTLEHTEIIKRSSLYQSAPIGETDQPDFINAVVQVKTRLTPHTLLTGLLAIEQACGRIRSYRNAPRTLDLDILLFDDRQCNDENLILPHPRMHERAFVLLPLLEIVDACHIPGRGDAVDCLANCTHQSIERITLS